MSSLNVVIELVKWTFELNFVRSKSNTAFYFNFRGGIILHSSILGLL